MKKRQRNKILKKYGPGAFSWRFPIWKSKQPIEFSVKDLNEFRRWIERKVYVWPTIEPIKTGTLKGK